MVSPLPHTTTRVGGLGRWVLAPQGAALLLLVGATLYGALLSICTSGVEAPTVRRILETAVSSVLVLVEISLSACLVKCLRASWAQLWRRVKHPPRTVSGHELCERHFSGTAPLAEWMKVWAEAITKEFGRTYTFHMLAPGHVAYVLYAKRGGLFLFSAPFIHAGVFCLILSMLLSLLASRSPESVHFALLLGAFFLASFGFGIRGLGAYQELWVRYADLEGRRYATVSFVSTASSAATRKAFIKTVASLEKAWARGGLH